LAGPRGRRIEPSISNADAVFKNHPGTLRLAGVEGNNNPGLRRNSYCLAVDLCAAADAKRGWIQSCLNSCVICNLNKAKIEGKLVGRVVRELQSVLFALPH